MMPLDNMFFVVPYIISGLTQGVVYGYFIHHYLEPKYGIRSLVYYGIGYIIYTFLILFLFYSDAFARMLLTISFLSTSALLFYKGKLAKRLLTGALLYITSGLAEVSAQFIIIFIFQYRVFDSLPISLLTIVLILSNIIIFIFTKALLRLTSIGFSFGKRYSKIFIALSVNILLIIIPVSGAFYSNSLFTYEAAGSFYARSIFIIVCCLIISSLITIYITYVLQKLKSSMSKELLIQSIYQQNMDQLTQYLETKESAYKTSELRHDIMNYLQTVKALKESETNEQ